MTRKMTTLSLMLCAASGLVSTAHAQDAGTTFHELKSYLGSDLPVATAKDDAVLRHVPDLEKTAHGYKNACGNRNRIGVLHLDLGGVLQGATVTYDPDSCWGQTGGELTVLDRNNRVVWHNGAVDITVLSTTQDGVHDLSFGQPGSTQPVWRWDSPTHQYKFLKTFQG
ncbi:hypothetical protein [Acetobacter pasteurianus]|uniref:hypothetical protein n=1 Tax=Acetobacter pasteurianus TaxID=438 RepID=UPI00038434AC|nr:hypothetical protein [Acetobacter pasteurianus]CCT58410.1 hypothetical protein APA386B_291 [Acetobacter pasteurianus 386B]